MDAVTIGTAVIKTIEVINDAYPTIMAGIDDLRLFATNLYRGIKGEPITDQELADLEKRIDELHASFQEQLPEEGE